MSSFRHVSETAVTVVAVLSSLCSDGRLEPGHQLSPRPSAVVHLDALRPGPQPDRSGVQPAHRCPAPIAGRPPAAACAPGGSHAARQRVTQRPACPAVMPISDPVPPSPEANGALAPDYRQGHRSAERVLPSHTCLLRSLALALAHRPSQFKRRRLQQHRKARRCKPASAAACSSRPRSASFLVAALSTGGQMVRNTARAVT